MSVWSSLGAWLSGGPVQEAADQRLNKTSKVQTGMEAVFLQDLQHLAFEDRDTVRRYRDKTLFGETSSNGGGPRNNDLIVADDVEFHVTRGAGATTLLAAALISVAILLAASQLIPRHPENAGPAPPQFDDTTLDIKPVPGR